MDYIDLGLKFRLIDTEKREKEKNIALLVVLKVVSNNAV